MFRTFKYLVATVLAVLLLGVVLLGPGFFSYLRTSAVSVRESVQGSVPIEFELRRAKEMIDQILPELQAQVRMIAQEEVEIAGLESEVSDSRNRLDREQRELAGIREQMRTQLVSYREGERNMTRTQMTEQLARRFERYKSGQLALASKERLLEKRNESLNAALSTLDSMRHRKAELEHKVEALAAQARLLEASKLESGLPVDGSELSSADQLLQQIETRLAVAERVLDHEQDLFSIDPDPETKDEQQVLAEYDQYFGNQFVSTESAE